eukprot:14386687-Heterocapsa_arctica.AAC.1
MLLTTPLRGERRDHIEARTGDSVVTARRDHIEVRTRDSVETARLALIITARCFIPTMICGTSTLCGSTACSWRCRASST